MKKTNQYSNKLTLTERLGVGFGISVLCIIALLIALLTNMTKPLPETYLINFYDGDNLITTEQVNEDEVISNARLEEIANIALDDSLEYKYVWSLRKDSYVKVNFNYLNKDTNVYLYKYLEEYQINVSEDGMFKYEILTDGPILDGSSVLVQIEQTVDPNLYHMNVYANNQMIAPNDDGNYLIENINSNVDVYVKYLDKLYLTPLLNDTYVYDGSIKDVGYIVSDYYGNSVDIKDILIRYYNSSGGLISNLLDAGKYKVEFIYTKDEFYIEDVTCEVEIKKAVPYVNVDDKYVYYDGTPQGFNILDIDTNSDGLITFTNNANIDIGKYLVGIKIHESNNYESVSLDAYLIIEKAKPNISENPIADVGFEGHTLDDVGFTDVDVSVEGSFKWKDPSMILVPGVNEYELVFTPVDTVHYYETTLHVEVNVLSHEEQLAHVKAQTDVLENEEDVIIDNRFITEYLDADIMWMSLSSVLMVDSGGNITVIGSPGTYTVDIIGIMIFGDTAEYVTVSLNVVIDTGGGIQLTRL